MLEVSLNDITINFGFKEVLKGVSFSVTTGEKVALVGGNGSGKTTLLRIIMGLQSYDKGSCTTRKGATVGYLEQDSDIASAITVEQFLKESQQEAFEMETKLRAMETRMSEPITPDQLDKLLSEYDKLQNQFAAIGGYETEAAFSRICGAFKFGEGFLTRECNQLSGGQKTIVKLARVLLQAPDILLLDEPTNHLDIETLEWLEGFLRDYKGTVILISHDRYFLDKTIKKTILLYQGQVEVYGGNYSFCLQEQERLMMLEFEKYKHQQRIIEHMKEEIKRIKLANRFSRRAVIMQRRLDRMVKLERPDVDPDKLPIHFAMGGRSGKRVITIRDLDFSYDSNSLLEKANMDVLFKDRVCLLGPNGTGKSTIIKLLMGQLTPNDGSVNLAESAKIGYIEQEVTFPNEKATILDAFREDAVIHENEARRILAKFFITGDDIYKRLHSLSGGERVILRLAMELQRPINFLILDEPTNHLDIDTKEILEESLADYKGTILFISHDRYFINRLATKIVYIKDKRLHSVDGNFDAYISS
ncbi:MAG: ATP-binding cassette domain-containing protein [Defluviitaleaceae bacterium]|nr:ATP-binding cassette domain-containing protein [Defluviitaleaceae bacterium]